MCGLQIPFDPIFSSLRDHFGPLFALLSAESPQVSSDATEKVHRQMEQDAVKLGLKAHRLRVFGRLREGCERNQRDCYVLLPSPGLENEPFVDAVYDLKAAHSLVFHVEIHPNLPPILAVTIPEGTQVYGITFAAYTGLLIGEEFIIEQVEVIA